VNHKFKNSMIMLIFLLLSFIIKSTAIITPHNNICAWNQFCYSGNLL